MINKKSSIKYFLNNIWWIMLTVLVPSILFAISTMSTRLSLHELWQQYFLGQIATTGEFLSKINVAYLLFSKFNTLGGALIDVLFAVSLAVAWSALAFKINRHMQLGILVSDNLIARISKIFARIFVWIIYIILFIQLALGAVVGIAYLCSINLPLNVVAIITLVATLIAIAIIVYMFGIFNLAMPIIVSEDYRLNVALSYAARLYTIRKSVKPILTLIGLIILFAVISILFAMIMPVYIVSVLYFMIVYMIYLGFVPVASCAQYMTDMNYERKDIKKYFN